MSVESYAVILLIIMFIVALSLGVLIEELWVRVDRAEAIIKSLVSSNLELVNMVKNTHHKKVANK